MPTEPNPATPLPDNPQPNQPDNPGQAIGPEAVTPTTSRPVVIPAQQSTQPVNTVAGEPIPGIEIYTSSQPFSSQPVSFSDQSVPKSKKRLTKSPLIIALLAIFVLMGSSGAAYFGYYLPNKPENMWAKSLSNMGKGYDKLANYVKDYKTSKGSKITGSFKVSGDTEASGSIDASNDGANGDYKINVNAGGIKADLELISIASSSKYPDIYLKLNGLDSAFGMLDSLSLELSQTAKSVNNQWYLIDHSLYEKYAGTSDAMDFSRADLNEAISAAAGPTKKYIFTSDTSKMAFVVKDTIGKEKQDDRNTYHYKIGVNKANLKAYNNELCDSLSKTKLFKLLENSGESAQALNDCKDTNDIDKMKDSDSTDVWVDTRTKLVHKVRFANDTTGNNYYDIFQDYQGGDVIPFGITYNEKSSGTNANGTLTVSLNMADNTVTVKANLKATGDTKETGSLDLKYSPSNTEVKVQKPAGAKDIKELLNSLGYGDVLQPSTPRNTDTPLILSN